MDLFPFNSSLRCLLWWVMLADLCVYMNTHETGDKAKKHPSFLYRSSYRVLGSHQASAPCASRLDLLWPLGLDTKNDMRMLGCYPLNKFVLIIWCSNVSVLHFVNSVKACAMTTELMHGATIRSYMRSNKYVVIMRVLRELLMTARMSRLLLLLMAARMSRLLLSCSP